MEIFNGLVDFFFKAVKTMFFTCFFKKKNTKVIIHYKAKKCLFSFIFI